MGKVKEFYLRLEDIDRALELGDDKFFEDMGYAQIYNEIHEIVKKRNELVNKLEETDSEMEMDKYNSQIFELNDELFWLVLNHKNNQN